MKKHLFILLSVLGISACQQGQTFMQDRTESLCGDKPNCVSTQDPREEHYIAPFILTLNADINEIEKQALQLPGAVLVKKDGNYLHMSCTTKILRFVDDLEMKIIDNQLLVRSESRVGYSDFGVNRKRVEQLRSMLQQAGLIQ